MQHTGEERAMHIPGPYSDDTWQWLPDARKETQTVRRESNRPAQVIWDIGVLLAIPLASAGIVCLFLKSVGIT
jgi:hypothetical protein